MKEGLSLGGFLREYTGQQPVRVQGADKEEDVPLVLEDAGLVIFTVGPDGGSIIVGCDFEE